MTFQTDLVVIVLVSAGLPSASMNGEHVLHPFRAPANHRHPANPAELMHRHQTADHRVIFTTTCPAMWPREHDDMIASWQSCAIWQ